LSFPRNLVPQRGRKINVTLEKQTMNRISKEAYTPEFKELAVKRVSGGEAISVVVKELVLSDQTLRNWIKASSEGKLKGADTKAVTPEAMELSRLRAEVVRLKRENEIIKKAAAYFAKDVL